MILIPYTTESTVPGKTATYCSISMMENSQHEIGGRPKALEGKRGDSTHWLSLGDQAPPRHLGAVQSMAA
ncbi:uncharacterized protein FFC1_02875 [Fusarium fujikuroi]|nr:uncharacterized protein FFC1_02875 [Fusarium fujikuroi]